MISTQQRILRVLEFGAYEGHSPTRAGSEPPAESWFHGYSPKSSTSIFESPATCVPTQSATQGVQRIISSASAAPHTISHKGVQRVCGYEDLEIHMTSPLHLKTRVHVNEHMRMHTCSAYLRESSMSSAAPMASHISPLLRLGPVSATHTHTQRQREASHIYTYTHAHTHIHFIHIYPPYPSSGFRSAGR
jgi:hypothetical protein